MSFSPVFPEFSAHIMTAHHLTHGGHLNALATLAQISPHDIMDFSVNVHPEGPSLHLKGALLRGFDDIIPYPSPFAEEACTATETFYKLAPNSVLYGNGSNQIIHLIPQAFAPQKVLILQPAFSEYELACQRYGIQVEHLHTSPKENFLPDKNLLRKKAQKVDMVFLANPANPSGALIPRDELMTCIQSTPQTLWVIDEAFIEFIGEEASLIPLIKDIPNALILRSLTKFHGMAGIRTGFVVAHEKMIAQMKAFVPAWSVGTLSINMACTLFSPDYTGQDEVRQTTQQLRNELFSALSEIEGIHPYPSHGNYILFSWDHAPKDTALHFLKKYHIALRDCANYPGLSQGEWFRVAVRTAPDHARLIDALSNYNADIRKNTPSLKTEESPSAPYIKKRIKTPALMIQGTCSDAGKSILTAALCRILKQDGHNVAPFKAQNMALNSGVTASGEEMGRAQIVQAAACKLAPDVRMNPVLLKPNTDTGSQVVVLGKPTRCMSAREYFSAKRLLWDTVRNTYDSLSSDYDVIIMEGAGSPGEINLKKADIVNMNMAAYAQASVLLAGDIDRGGVYASLLGTWMTFTPEEKRLTKGFIINKFRGDASLLKSAHDYVQTLTGIPVMGVIPMIRNLRLPEEDRPIFSFDQTQSTESPDGILDIAVILLGHVSNYTDFAPLAMEPDVRLRPVRKVEDFGSPHLVIIPGSKNVVGDLRILRERGLDNLILDHAAQDKPILGICGGLQILGKNIADPLHIETSELDYPGLNLLNISTTMEAEKMLIHLDTARTPLGLTTSGYEIHHGLTHADEGVQSLFTRPDGSVCGYGQGNIWGTYLHGHLDSDTYRRAYLDHVRQLSGLPMAGKILARYDLDGALDELAHTVRECLDMKSIYKLIRN